MSATVPLAALTPSFAPTREALRTLACYAMSPARKARTGEISLRSHDGGIATPPFADRTRIGLRADVLTSTSGDAVRVTTVAAAAGFLGVELSTDPGVGHDLPPFTPHAALAVDPDASLALGAWYAFGQRVLDQLERVLPAGATATEGELWPEHFDLAVVATYADGRRVNVGFSPGDAFHRHPYAYVGPWDVAPLDRTDAYWNAPFGAVLGYDRLEGLPDPDGPALAFVEAGLRRV